MSSMDDAAEQGKSWAREGGRRARRAAEDAEEAVADTVHRVGRRARKVADELTSQGDDALDAIESRVRANPLAGLGIAFLLGFLLCLFFGRR